MPKHRHIAVLPNGAVVAVIRRMGRWEVPRPDLGVVQHFASLWRAKTTLRTHGANIKTFTDAKTA